MMSINTLISSFMGLYTIDGFTFILEIHEANETTQSNTQITNNDTLVWYDKRITYIPRIPCTWVHYIITIKEGDC